MASSLKYLLLASLSLTCILSSCTNFMEPQSAVQEFTITAFVSNDPIPDDIAAVDTANMQTVLTFIKGDSAWFACVINPSDAPVNKLRWISTYGNFSTNEACWDSSGTRVWGPILPISPIAGEPRYGSLTLHAEAIIGGRVITSNQIHITAINYEPVQISEFSCIEPAQGSVTTDPRDSIIMFTWNEAGYNADPLTYYKSPVDSYQVFISTDQAFSQVPVASTTTPQVNIAEHFPLQRATTYYWYIKAFVTAPDMRSGEAVTDTQDSDILIFTTTSPPL